VIALVVSAALVIGLVVGELGDSGLGRRWALLAVPLLAAGAWLARLRLPAGNGAPVILRPGAVLVAAAAVTALFAAIGSLSGGWPGSWPGVLALGLLALGVAQLAGARSELPGSRSERPGSGRLGSGRGR
jgi:peptidoglycan/LPS O-acetylase OafA/YrhL